MSVAGRRVVEYAVAVVFALVGRAGPDGWDVRDWDARWWA
jgi:hypothetical protein